MQQPAEDPLDHRIALGERNPLHHRGIEGAAKCREVNTTGIRGTIQPLQLAPLLLMQIGAEEHTRERDQARERQRILKTAIRIEFEQRQQGTPPVAKASTQQRLAKCRKCVSGRALHTARDTLHVAEAEQLLNTILDPRRGDQPTIGHP